jgi:RimJ/RimL family protein N-acetyltransferase
MFSIISVLIRLEQMFSNNLKSMHVLVKCGFMQEAILQKAVYKYEQYLDEHLYAIFNPNIES